MSAQPNILNTTPADIDLIFRFFDAAIAYQQKKGYNLWPRFERSLIETEIDEKRHYKVMEDGNVLGIFSVVYSDPVIWGERNADPAVYLHRITVNSEFKGRQIMIPIREWAIAHAKATGKKYVRMDTWGSNETLRNYYIACGFTYIGQQHLTQAPGLPLHYGGAELSLFEVGVG